MINKQQCNKIITLVLFSGLTLATTQVTYGTNVPLPGDLTELEAELSGAAEPEATGEVSLEVEAGDPVEKFEAHFETPLSGVLGLTDAEAAQEAHVFLTLHRDGNPYARCRVSYKEYKDNLASYSLVIENWEGYLLPEGGVCDVDLDKEGIQPGLPKLKVDDEVTTKITSAPDAVFLSGKVENEVDED